MSIISFALLVIGLIILLFGFVVAFGAPFLPTLNKQTEDIFTLLNLNPGQILLELGSGDGRVLLAAAKRGITAIGYELNPLLATFSWLRCFRYRHLITVRWGNYWQASWPPCDGIYVFLLDKYMKKLDKKIIREISKPVKLVSFAFKIPNKRVVTESHGLLLYEYQK
ncbi:hypothetical protein H0V99_00985 [Candidatus Saccharibacteria bacterium]|nr:hypothetical protein [Candidatus Saccharibacteria bacterium]